MFFDFWPNLHNVFQTRTSQMPSKELLGEKKKITRKKKEMNFNGLLLCFLFFKLKIFNSEEK